MEISTTGGAASPAKRAISTQTSVEIKSGHSAATGDGARNRNRLHQHRCTWHQGPCRCHPATAQPGAPALQAALLDRRRDGRRPGWVAGLAMGTEGSLSGTRLHQTAKHPRYVHPDRLLRAMQDRQGLA